MNAEYLLVPVWSDKAATQQIPLQLLSYSPNLDMAQAIITYISCNITI